MQQQMPTSDHRRKEILALELAEVIQRSLQDGALSQPKKLGNTPANLGKSSVLVLAEQMLKNGVLLPPRVITKKL